MDHPLLAVYKPSADDPFDAIKAAHLLDRAGFGGTPDEIEKILKMGPEAAVDWLMDFPDSPVEESSPEDVPDLSTIDGFPANFREYEKMFVGKTVEEKKAIKQKFMMANREALGATGRWWMKRMAEKAYPLQEKLTLFWHGHFTTSAKDERSALLMWRQNELLRRMAAGNFEKFVRAISRDPAMLDYLNNNQNKKQHPNENYARELMELFTLGIGNYTEKDIKESARAFTGWGHDGDSFVYRKNDHDTGDKEFLGQHGNFDGDDILSIILKQPACPKFVAGEMFKYFAYEDFDGSMGQALGDVLLSNHYELRPLIRTILTSKAFYSEQSVGVQIKSPIQLIVGTVRMLGLEMPKEGPLASALNQMGQMPLMPPNVRGWPGGHLWINTSTLFIRYNTGLWLAGGDVPALYRVGRKGDGSGKELKVPHGQVDFEPNIKGTAQEVVGQWVDRLIHRPLDDDKKKVLSEVVAASPNNLESQRKLVQLIVSMPEYQLC